MHGLLKVGLLLCLTQFATAQSLFKGFIPDENGTNPDVLVQQKVTPGAIFKDCAECPEMVVIPAGSFLMGSDRETPSHPVTIRSFLLGNTEVTHKLWVEVMGSNPSRFASCGPECPVQEISWDNAQQFIVKLNQKTGQKYRLPSEAEWEYSARAGTTTEWGYGNDESALGDYAWYDRNSGRRAHEVKQKTPNAFGLFDMHGNVWEWTQDCMHANYVGAPADGSAWTTACAGNYRVLRGGSWNNYPASLRSANRFADSPANRFYGLRLARDI